MTPNPHLGSSLEDFLAEEGRLDEATATAVKRVLAWQIAEQMKAERITKAEMARRMRTSRSQLDRLLDPEKTTVQLNTLLEAARALGRQLRPQQESHFACFEPMAPKRGITDRFRHCLSKELTMSSPQKSSLFSAEAHRAYINESARGHAKTLLIFSIHDGKHLSWYSFHEDSPRYSAAEFLDYEKGEQDERSQWTFGHRIQPLMFKSRVPRQVNQFVEPRGPEDAEKLRQRRAYKDWGEVKAQLASVRGNDLHQMTVILQLSSGAERFNLLLASRKPVTYPAPLEKGVVVLRGTEPFSASGLNDSWRWRKLGAFDPP
jgi:antitoxin HicB